MKTLMDIARQADIGVPAQMDEPHNANAQHGDNPALPGFASETLPALQQIR